MKNLKRIACLVLAIAVVCSLGLTALAASENPYTSVTADTRGEAFPDVTAANAEEAIYALVALGVFEGYPDGEFKPAKTIQRAEFAKIVYYFCGMDAKDLPYWESIKSQFPDIYEGHWAEGYINFAAINGYFIGYADGNFQPSNELTMQEAATVLLRVLGYNDNLQGVWPHDYNRKAVDIGLTEYVNYIGGAPASRNVVAQMSYNILDAYKVTYIADKTAASMGYLSGGAAALLGNLYTELEKVAGNPGNNGVIDTTVANVLGMINMYAVDDEQFAYMYGRTNEGTVVYYDLLAAAFGAVKLDVKFDGLDAKDELGVADTLIESKGWFVADAVKGQLALSYTAYSNISALIPGTHFTTGLSSLYYIAGGDLTDLGDTTGRVIVRGGEAIFAATDGRGAFYTNNPVALDYYDYYATEGFAIFGGAVANRAGYTTVTYTTYQGLDNDATSTVEPKSATFKTALMNTLFYNMTTGKFVGLNELAAGDVLYAAGNVGATSLVLVYNPSVAAMTKVTQWNANAANLITINGVGYTYENPAALISLNGGAYQKVNYTTLWTAFNNAAYLVTKDVSYVPAYRSTELAYIAHGTPAVGAYNHGVVTGFTYGYDYVAEGNIFHVVRATTGITMFDKTGAEVTYEFANSYLGTSDIEVGDLITVSLNAAGKINNTTEGAIKTFGVTNVEFEKDLDVVPVTTNAALSRVTIGNDIYTLAADATIFSVSAAATPAGLAFAGVELMTAAEFLAIPSYKLNQANVCAVLGNNNTITCLYVVNAVAADVTNTGIVVETALVNIDGKACYALTMLDGSVKIVADKYPAPDFELQDAYCPALISYQTNHEGFVFNVSVIAHLWSDNGTDFYVCEDGSYGAGKFSVTGTIDTIYNNSIVDEGNTLFLTDSTVIFNLKTGKADTMANIVAEADVAGTLGSATLVTYVYNAITHDVVYIFTGANVIASSAELV